jgi:hypothetical protein
VVRVLPALVIGAAVLGFTALPASAAAVSHPKVHTFTLPPVTGITVKGSYSLAAGKADITLCVKETASDVQAAFAVATALNGSASKHQDIEIELVGSGKQACKSMVTSDTASLYVAASSATSDGKTHASKAVKIY